MKKIMLAFVLVCLLVVPASAKNFVELGRNDNAVVSIDTDSINSRGDYVVAWVKWIYRGESLKNLRKDYPKATQTLQLIAFNKQFKQFQFLNAHCYDDKGTLIDSFSNSFARHKYEEIAPGTILESLYDAAMDFYEQKTSQ